MNSELEKSCMFVFHGYPLDIVSGPSQFDLQEGSFALYGP